MLQLNLDSNILSVLSILRAYFQQEDKERIFLLFYFARKHENSYNFFRFYGCLIKNYPVIGSTTSKPGAVMMISFGPTSPFSERICRISPTDFLRCGRSQPGLLLG